MCQVCYHAIMKLSEYARRAGVSYKTAWRWWQAGHLDAYQAASGTIMVREAANTASRLPDDRRVAVYARVSAAEHRPHLESQAERLVPYGAAKGYQVPQLVREIGSSVNNSRPPVPQTACRPARYGDRGRALGSRDALWMSLSRN